MTTESEKEYYDVFISHAGDGGSKTFQALPLKRLFEYVGISAFVDEKDLKVGAIAQERIKEIAERSTVYLVLLDNKYYIRSIYCMTELRDAIKRDQYIFPVFLNDTSNYPITVEDVRKVVSENEIEDWGTEWSYEEIATIFELVIARTGLKPYEDKYFQPEHIVVSVESYLKGKGALVGLDLIERNSARERVEFLKNRGAVKKEYRVRKCAPEPLDEKSIEVHVVEYDEVKANLLGVGSVSTSNIVTGKRVVGIGGSGGTGKTWLALRIAHDKAIIKKFVGRVFWVTFGADRVARKAFEDLWWDLGGSELEKVKFDVQYAFEMLDQLLEGTSSQILIVLDDVWHQEHLAVFEKLIRKHDNVRLLITTRLTEIIGETFGDSKCEVVSLTPRLERDEALKLMTTYSDFRGGVLEDVESMIRIAERFGFHPKALSILGTQAPNHDSWLSLAQYIEKRSIEGTHQGETEDPVKYVYEAVDAVFAYRKYKALKDNFLVLGVFKEDKTFSLQDVAVVLDSDVDMVKGVVATFLGCSLLEERHKRLASHDPVYSLHDLLRDYAREKGLTNKIERNAVKRMCRVAEKDLSNVTSYIFENLEDHLGDKAKKLRYKLQQGYRVAVKLRGIVQKAGRGEVDRSFHKNFYLMSLAFGVNPSILKNADQSTIDLLLTDPDFFTKALNPEITSLDLSEKAQWLNQTDVAAAFCEALASNESLQTLNLYGNQIADEGAIALGKGLEKNSTLKTLNLWNNQIADEGAIALGKALEKHSSLQNLDLWNNQIADGGAIALGKTLEKNSSLQTLDLYGNQIADEGAMALGKGLEKNSTLQTLKLYNNEIADEGAIALGRALEKNATLQTLSLWKNQIADEAAVALGKSLQKNSSLRTLDLRQNQIADEGAIALGKGLMKNSTLEYLSLPHNEIADEGAMALGKGLEKNSSLQALNFAYNQIADEGAIALGKSLEKNCSLQTLDLYWNDRINATVRNSLRSKDSRIGI